MLQKEPNTTLGLNIVEMGDLQKNNRNKAADAQTAFILGCNDDYLYFIVGHVNMSTALFFFLKPKHPRLNKIFLSFFWLQIAGI